MSARSSYSLRITRGSPGPAALAMPGRSDQVELVDLTSGESVLFWEGPPVEAKRLAKALKRDLRTMTAETFKAAWLHKEQGQPTPEGDDRPDQRI